MQEPNNKNAVELRQIDSRRRRARRYHMAPARSLFGEPGLLITWGRIGQKPRLRFEAFASEAELDARWCELLARRRAHGYRLDSPMPIEHPDFSYGPINSGVCDWDSLANVV
jgi:predicted DNA-binding WGR domain protein